VHRVATDLIGAGLQLAVTGLFDDAAPFEQPLA
jgi:hypothetical protein